MRTFTNKNMVRNKTNIKNLYIYKNLKNKTRHGKKSIKTTLYDSIVFSQL